MKTLAGLAVIAYATIASCLLISRSGELSRARDDLAKLKEQCDAKQQQLDNYSADAFESAAEDYLVRKLKILHRETCTGFAERVLAKHPELSDELIEAHNWVDQRMAINERALWAQHRDDPRVQWEQARERRYQQRLEQVRQENDVAAKTEAARRGKETDEKIKNAGGPQS